MTLNREDLLVVGLLAGPLTVAAAMMLALGLLILDGRFVASEFVLTAAGCETIEQHGGRIEPLPAQGYCKLTADYDGLDWLAQHTPLRLRIGAEMKVIELADHAIVSRLTREH